MSETKTDTAGPSAPPASRATEAEHRARMLELKRRQDAEARARQIRRGIIVVNDGDGKGKSTAAFGMALRAVGHGQRVATIQFIKGTWRTGEREALARFPEIDWFVSGEGFTWNTQDRARDTQAARRGLALAREAIEASRGPNPKYSLLILDEIHIALRYDYLPVDDVVELLRDRPTELSIVLTGRDAPPEIVELADTVTRMECVKHAYAAGIRARKGIDF